MRLKMIEIVKWGFLSALAVQLWGWKD